MPFYRSLCSLAASVVLALPLTVAAQQAPLPYGPTISLEQAKRAMAAAEAEATRNGWPVAIAIVDSGGSLVMLERLDNTLLASVDLAKGKALTAVTFKRPTKVLEDAVAGGGAGLRLLRVEGVTPLEGGIPIVIDGRIVGGIGTSGVLSSQDAQVSQAGLNALR
jgi:uncharacterized protein GlcG (DUF336 family)